MYNIQYINAQNVSTNFENTKEKVLKKNADRVKKNQPDAQLILSIFRQPLHVSAYLGPSSGGTSVHMQQLVLIFLYDSLNVQKLYTYGFTC